MTAWAFLLDWKKRRRTFAPPSVPMRLGSPNWPSPCRTSVALPLLLVMRKQSADSSGFPEASDPQRVTRSMSRTAFPARSRSLVTGIGRGNRTDCWAVAARTVGDGAAESGWRELRTAARGQKERYGRHLRVVSTSPILLPPKTEHCQVPMTPARSPFRPERTCGRLTRTRATPLGMTETHRSPTGTARHQDRIIVVTGRDVRPPYPIAHTTLRSSIIRPDKSSTRYTPTQRISKVAGNDGVKRSVVILPPVRSSSPAIYRPIAAIVTHLPTVRLLPSAGPRRIDCDACESPHRREEKDARPLIRQVIRRLDAIHLRRYPSPRS